MDPKAPIYVDAALGCDDNKGDGWTTALKTIGKALTKVGRGGTIHLYGKFLEDGLVTPHGITDVTVVGHGTRPREGNSGRAAGPKGGAVDWRWKDDNTDKPLLHVTQQGWRFSNLMIRGSENGGGILLTRNMLAETSDQGIAGDHATFEGCTFQGPSAFGICAEGGLAGVHVLNCHFRMFSKPNQAAVLGRTGEGVGSAIFWKIDHNLFQANWSDVVVALAEGIVTHNFFIRRSLLSSGIPDGTPSVDFTNGRGNLVGWNWWDEGSVNIHAVYDRWHGNIGVEDVK